MYQKKVSTFLRCLLVAAPVVMLTASPAFAQAVIDGSVSGDTAFYGAALSTQDTPTGFGDAFIGDQVQTGGGSEINQAFANIANGRLYVMITGNLEENFNKMSFFFDTRPGGWNEIDGNMLPQGVDGFCCGGFGTTDGALQRQNGLNFDAGFEADYFLTMSNGTETALDDPNAPGNPIQFWAVSAHYSDMTAGAAADRQNVAAGMQLAPQGLPNVLRDTAGGPLTDLPYLPDFLAGGFTVPDHVGEALPNLSQGELIDRNYALGDGGCVDDTGTGCLPTEVGFALDQSPTDPSNSLSHRRFNNLIDLQMALDNSNLDGLPTMAADTAVTGLEFSIPLSELGNPTGDFRMVGFINGTGHDFLSNQFIGDGLGPNTGNLAAPDTVDLSIFDGDQFVTIAYTPPTVNGDFNMDGNWDCTDIDALVVEVAGMTGNLDFDMNSDDSLDFADVQEWLVVGGVQNPMQTNGNAFLIGDANLDGVVDGLDFIEWNMNKFTSAAAWCSGDFNADGIVDGLDFIAWNENKFTSSGDVSAVPEPATGLMLLVGCLLCARIRRR